MTHVDAGIQTPVFQQMHGLITNTHLWGYNVGVLLIHAILASLFLLLPKELQHLSLSWQMPTWQIYFIALFFSVVLMGALMRKRGEAPPWLIASCGWVLIIGFTGTLFFKSQILFLVSLTFFFGAFNWLEAQLPALVSSHVPSNQRGTALGIFSTFQFLGIFIGGAFGGWMLEHYGTLPLILLFCSIILIWAYALIKLGARRPAEV
jgi:MFS family permease